MATTFDGVPVKDAALAALLHSAQEQGFRIAEARNGGHQRGSGLVVYPPDKDAQPVRLGVVKVNPKHVLNVRSALRAVGYVDPGCDPAAPATAPTEQETEMSRTPRKAQQKHAHPSNLAEALDGLPQGERAQFVGHVASSSVGHLGSGPAVQALVGVLVETLAEWATDPAIRATLAEEFGGASASEMREALDLATAAEARAVAAEAALAKAEAREQQARADCGAALDRAKKAEAERDALDAALRPLRAILAPQ